jgi:hypothetical protein
MMAEAVPMAMNSRSLRKGVARVSTRNKQAVIAHDILFYVYLPYMIYVWSPYYGVIFEKFRWLNLC